MVNADDHAISRVSDRPPPPLEFVDFKQMGFGLAVAVLIDATIIRGVLLPASMKVLGN